MGEYPLNAKIWQRDSTNEWVLELSGSFNDTNFNCRHTEPLTLPPQDVAGLPSVYDRITALEQALEIAREALPRAIHTIEYLADQQAMDDDWYEKPLADIKDALSKIDAVMKEEK